MNKPFRLRYVSEIVGGFVAVVVIVILTITGGVIHRQGWFIPEFKVSTRISQEDTDGLNKGAPVVLLGKEIGTVESIEYVAPEADAPEKNVEVVMNLKENYRDQIFQDSVAVIRRRMAGTGEAYFDIARGTTASDEIESGGKIESRPAASTTSEVENIVESVDEISTNVDSAEENFGKVQIDFSEIQGDFSTIQGDFSEIQQDVSSAQQDFLQVRQDFSQVRDRFALIQGDFRIVRENTDVVREDFKRIAEQEFPRMVDNVKQTREAVQAFQKSADETFGALESDWEKIAENSTRTADSIEMASSSISNNIQEIRNSAVPAFASFDKASSDLQVLVSEVRATNERLQPIITNADTFFKDATEISATVKTEVEQLPGTVKKVQNTLDDAEVIAGGLKRHKLLRRYVDQGNGSREIAPSRVGRGGF